MGERCLVLLELDVPGCGGIQDGFLFSEEKGWKLGLGEEEEVRGRDWEERREEKL